MSQTRKDRLYFISFLILCNIFAGIKSFAQPVINSINPTTVCQGDSVTITGTGFTEVTAVTLGTKDSLNFKVIDNKTIVAYIDDNAKSGGIAVITSKGTSNNINITVNEIPDPDLEDLNKSEEVPFTNCDSSTTYQLNVKNITTNSQSNCIYNIDWGDGSTTFNQTDWPVNSTISHNYLSQGYFKIIFTITTSKGCFKSKLINFYNGNNPLASFSTTAPTTGLCVPATVNFIIGNWFSNSAGTTYQIDFGDGSPFVNLKHPLNNNNTDEIVSHIYTKSSCPNYTDYTAYLRAINGCFTTTYTLNQIIVREKPKADFKWLPDTGCVTEPVCFTNETTDGYSGNSTCNTNANYVWDFGDGKTSTDQYPGCHQYSKAGTYTVKLTASNNSCGSDAITKKVVVQPTSEKPTADPVNYCVGETPAPLTAKGSHLLWYTSATDDNGSAAAPIPSTLSPGTTTYYVSQTIDGQCESQRIPVTVTVYALPSAPGVTTPVKLCKGKTTGQLTATGTNLLWYTSATGGTGSTTAPTPNTKNVGTVFYYVSQTTNGCEGPRAAIEVDVSDIPAIPTATTPVTYCQNQQAYPLTADGSGMLWYTSATGGTGSTVAPTPVTSIPGTTYYYVSASNYCGESDRAKIEVDVLAGPSATIGYNKNVLCNSIDGSPDPNPPLPVIISGSKGGTFSISPSGLPIDPTTGTISPSGAVAGTYTIKYYIKSSGGCSDFTTTTNVTVTNSPSAKISYTAICNSDDKATVNLTGTPGGIFTSTTGLNIDATTGTIYPNTSTPGDYIVTYTIAAASPCPGFKTTTNITITKAPNATISYDITNLCNVINSDTTPNPPVKIKLKGTPGGTFSISPKTGLTMDDDGTLHPSGASAGNYTITYTVAASGGCGIFTTSTTVAVSSSPSATIQYQPICSSDAPVSVVFSGTQGGTFSSTTGLDINETTGVITPASSKTGTYNVTYTIAPSAPCPGFSVNTTVVITAAPQATISYGKTNLCNVINTDNSNPDVAVIFSGTKGGKYSINPSQGLTINSNTGTIAPSGATPGTYTITYTVKASGGCAEYSTSTTIVIDKTPDATIHYDAPFCTGTNSLQSVVINGTTGGTFSSTAGLSLDANTGDINPSMSKPGDYTITYTIAPSSPCPGFKTSTDITIIESPTISFDVSSQSVCSATPAIFKPTSSVTTTIYNWSVKGTLPPNISGATSGSITGEGAAISLLFTNSGTTSETINVEVTPMNSTGSQCAGAPYELSVTVNPIPLKLKSDTTEFCMHAPPMALSADADAGNTVKWYDENKVLLNAAPVINTQTPAQFIYYATQTNIYGCESPSSKFVAIVHPVAKIISSSYLNPSSCGIPSGSVTLNIVDLNGNAMPNMPTIVHFTKFQVEYVVKDSTDATGKIFIPLTAGTYSDFYVETFSCLSQKIPDVFVLKDPTPPEQPVAGYNAPLCSESVLNLSASSPTSSQTGIINYVWVGPAFGNEPDTSQNTVVTFPSAKTSYNGLYIVYAIQNNCISTATSFTVAIKQSPTKPVIATKTPLCVGDNLTLTATSSIIGNNTLNYVWNGPGTGFPVNSAYAGITPVKIEDGGVYSITVTSPQTGCSATADTLIAVGGYPIVKFSKDSFNVPTGYIMKLAPSIVNASDKNILPISKYEWTPTDNIQCNDAPCSLPTINVKKDICYTVKATSVYGCSGSDTLCISTFCTNAQVFVPNAFTPRGLSVNSKFMVRASGIASVKSFRVFNRWGRIVFEKNNFPPNDPNYGWDGYVNGKLADMGVYVYSIEVVCENGTPYTYKGNVTLLQ